MNSPEFEAFYQKILSRPAPPEPTLEQMRARFTALMADFAPDPAISIEPVSIGPIHGQWLRAPKAREDRAILFFHGGGFIVGSPETPGHLELAGRLSLATGCSVLATSYRLAPEHTFPAQLEDALTAYHYIQKKCPHLVLGGLSAGGGLVLSLLLSLKQRQEPLPLGSFLLSPWVDLTLQGESILTNNGKDMLAKRRNEITRDLFLQGNDPKNPLISPLFGDLSGLPPLLLQVGSRELFYSEDVQLAEKAKKQKVDVTLQVHEGMFHAWHLFAAHFPEAQHSIDEVGKYVKKLFS